MYYYVEKSIDDTYKEMTAVSDEFDFNRYCAQVGGHGEISRAGSEKKGGTDPVECSLTDCFWKVVDNMSSSNEYLSSKATTTYQVWSCPRL